MAAHHRVKLSGKTSMWREGMAAHAARRRHEIELVGAISAARRIGGVSRQAANSAWRHRSMAYWRRVAWRLASASRRAALSKMAASSLAGMAACVVASAQLRIMAAAASSLSVAAWRRQNGGEAALESKSNGENKRGESVAMIGENMAAALKASGGTRSARTARRHDVRPRSSRSRNVGATKTAWRRAARGVAAYRAACRKREESAWRINKTGAISGGERRHGALRRRRRRRRRMASCAAMQQISGKRKPENNRRRNGIGISAMAAKAGAKNIARENGIKRRG